MDKYTLIIAVLTVKSSYLNSIEEPLAVGDTPDTVQFWLDADKNVAWRIKTFAIDHDIHVHSIDSKKKSDADTVDLFVQNTKKHYGDIIDSLKVIKFDDLANTELVEQVFKGNGLAPNLEIYEEFAFWNPDNQEYINQSAPQD